MNANLIEEGIAQAILRRGNLSQIIPPSSSHTYRHIPTEKIIKVMERTEITAENLVD